MDFNPQVLIEVAKKLALLSETLERKGIADSQRQEQAAQGLIQTVQGVRNDVANLVQNSGQQVIQASRQGVSQGLSESTTQFQNAIQSGVSELNTSLRAFSSTLEQARGQVGKQIRQVYLVTLTALVVLIAGGGFVLWMQWQTYNDTKEKLASAQINEELVQAYEQVGMTSCGGHPCVQLDSKAPRWGDKGQYILIDTAKKH